MRESEFLSILSNTEEGKKYIELISICRERQLGKQPGYEIHHIHPKGLGGKDIPDNTAKLSIYEHCLAHLLLAKAIPCSYTLKPIVRMSYSQYGRLTDLDKITLEEVYHWSELREKAIHSKHSESQKLHISRSRKGQICNNRNTVWLHRKNVNRRVPVASVPEYIQRGWVKGRKEESCKHISQSKKGYPSPRKGMKLSIEQRKKLSEAHKGYKASEESCKKRSVSIRKFYKEHLGYLKGRNVGTVWVHKGMYRVRIEMQDLQEYLQKGFLRGMK